MDVVNILVQIIENDPCTHGYPTTADKEEIEESSFSVIQFK